MRPLALDPDRIAELVHGGLAAGGTFSMGVCGALAEFTVAGAEPDVRRCGPARRTIEAVTSGGAIRLTITDETTAYDAGPDGAVTLAVPRSALPPPSLQVTAAPADPAALRAEDHDGVLVDLAVGHSVAAFCVRTADPALIAALRVVEGAGWREALDRVGHLLVAASPHRVVTCPLGRIEVYNPIPHEPDTSPAGCHTHLLPGLLETGREMIGGGRLPAQLAAAVTFTGHP